MTETNTQVGDRYLRGRPFLVVNTVSKPKRGIKTEVGGWTKVPTNWDVNEVVSIVDRVTDRALIENAVIVDIVNRKIVKNRYHEEMPGDKVVDLMLSRHAEKVAEGLSVWTSMQKQTQAN